MRAAGNSLGPMSFSIRRIINITLFQILADLAGMDLIKEDMLPEKESDRWTHPFVLKSKQDRDRYCSAKSLDSRCVIVEPFLAKYMREHQRQGVQFLFDCVSGGHPEGLGCILADDMVTAQYGLT